ncbi:MAG: hypothetical protein ABEN55_00115 [Bradymonadaceae bacterium]
MRRRRRSLQSIPYREGEYWELDEKQYPSATDPEYRERLNHFDQLSEQAWPQIPAYEYTESEHEVWSLLTDVLSPLQKRYCCEAFRKGVRHLELPADRVPQLDDISAELERKTGFVLGPVGGIINEAEFLSALADNVLRCAPYVRHPDNPFFSPIPDIIHELRGHAPMLLHEPFLDLSIQIGESAEMAVEAGDEEWLETIGLFYWYTFETGLMREDGEIRVFGAALATGALNAMDPTSTRIPFSLDAVRNRTIDWEQPQQEFLVADSLQEIIDAAERLATPECVA